MHALLLLALLRYVDLRSHNTAGGGLATADRKPTTIWRLRFEVANRVSSTAAELATDIL